MALSLTSTESEDQGILSLADPGRRQRLIQYGLYGGLLPVTVLLLAAAGWYIATGETPIALVKRLTTTPSFSMALPPPLGAPKPAVAEKAKTAAAPDTSNTALLQPPEPAAGALPKAAVDVGKPPEPAKGVMPQAPPPEVKPVEPASGAMPKQAADESKPPAPAADKTAEAKPAEPETPAAPAPATTALTPMKPTPMNKVAEVPAPAPAATEPAAPAPAAEQPAPAAEQQTALTAPPPPPPIVEPQAPPAGEPLAPPSFKQLPPRADLKPLPKAPQPDLLKDSPDGPLPITDGSKEPRTAYARPFVEPKDKAVKVAVVVVGLGVSREAAEAAIAKLPPEIDLSFSPYAGNLDSWVKKARDAGHEVLLDLPLEPANFPMHDAGPLAIMAHDAPASISDRLNQILGKTTSYVGLSAALHSPVTSGGPWAPLLHEARSRGLLVLGDGFAGLNAADAPAVATVSLVPDETPFRAAIDANLARLLATAQRDGSAIAYVSPRPVTFERLLAWAATLPQKGAVLVPASALVQAPQS